MRLLRHFRSTEGLIDTGIAAALVAMSVVTSLSAVNEGNRVTQASGFLWLLVISPGVAVAFRRLFPLTVLAVVTVATMSIWATGLPESALAGICALYSAVVYGSQRSGLKAAIASATTLTLFTTLGALVDDVPVYIIGLVGITCIAGIALGAHAATRQRYLNEVLERAAESKAHQKASEAAIVSQERNRIARELHDVVAHGLSVIVVQAGAAQRVLDSDPDGARQALGQTERVARESLREMRQVLGILRSDDDGSFRPTPGLAALRELVDDFESASLSISLDLDVPPNTDGLISSGNGTLDTTAYRIVQESLTNVLKHAGEEVLAWVTVRRRPECLHITVADNGRGLAAARMVDGHGLRGMRERVELFGGSLRTGGRIGGGFQVEARLPVESATP